MEDAKRYLENTKGMRPYPVYDGILRWNGETFEPLAEYGRGD